MIIVEYPKPIMKISELISIGFPEEMLFNAYRTKGQRFAQKSNPAVKNSAIIFDTAEFDKWRMKQLETENKALSSR